MGITSLCLNSRYTLRTQMFLAFGSTALIALGTFTVIGLYTAYNSGDSVKYEARVVVEELIRNSLSRTAEYVADTVTKKFNNIGSAGSILAEATRDRFVGYPTSTGWIDDQYVPFPDLLSGRNIYPLIGKDMPLDWNVTENFDYTSTTATAEHLPKRPYTWWNPQRTKLTTANAAYFMQGACDPTVNNVSDPTYYQGCTDENNDLRTGGVVKPTANNFFIYDKAKDFAWLLKALFEIHTDAKTIGIFFANDGAGSTVTFPGHQYDGTVEYESIGCNWMRTTHPRNGQFIATLEEVQNCHTRGERAPMREYNPLERQWCRDQVERDMLLAEGKSSLTAQNIMSTGPYLDAASSDNMWVLTFGQAVFDRETHMFIGCTLVDVSVEQLFDVLLGSTMVGETAESALVRWDELGSVIVATQWNPKEEDEIAYVVQDGIDLNLGITEEIFSEMKNLVDFSEPWDPRYARKVYEETVLENDGKLVMMHPIPPIPYVYDPLYFPEYMIIISLDEQEAYGLLDSMDVIIDQDVSDSWKQIGKLVGIGSAVVVFSILFISLSLVRPLRWMQHVAGMIIESAGNVGSDNLKENLLEELDSGDSKQFCAPKTEVTQLLKEFDKMIRHFSGSGASEVAGQVLNEVKNQFEWRRMYEDIYPWKTVDEEGGKVPGTKYPRSLSIVHEKEDDFEDDLTMDSTTKTQESILASLRSSVAALQEHPQVQTAVSKGSFLLSSVRDIAVAVGQRYGVIKEDEEEEVLEGPPFINRGPNIVHDEEKVDEDDFFEGVTSAEKSYLFYWTALLVGTPILVTAVLVSISVANDTTELIPVWLAEVKSRSFDIESEAIRTTANARAYFAEEVMFRFVRDIHVYSRLAGWLLFGAVDRANSFTKFVSGGDDCKNYEKGSGTCPFFADPENTVCDCEWGETRDIACQEFPNDEFPSTTNTRPYQLRFVEGQANDINANGTRITTSFPEVAVHPSATKWWEFSDMQNIPGFEKGPNAAGHLTTYDRVRVTSAMGPGEFLIFNYNAGVGEQKHIGSFIGFEADGMMTGWGFCSHGHVEYPHWRADSVAESLRPNLCPDQKYGYDARCRPWYDEGMKAGGTYVTPPYPFVNSDVFAGSATFSLVDPKTKELVGQTSLDFLPDAFMSALNSEKTPIGYSESGFPVVITPTVGSNGGDTLIGPGFQIKDGKPAMIGDVVLPFDAAESENRIFFEAQIAGRMRAGERGDGVFFRSRNEKGDQEEVFMTYAPVYALTLNPVDSADLSRGSTANETLIYSIGLGITVEDLRFPFKSVEKKVRSEINMANYISLALIIAAFLGVIWMTYTMCLYIARPIMVLISIVIGLESKDIQDELPELQGGSCEIYDVYDSLEKLCKIVRFTNAAFFKGDRMRSYKVLAEALELFMSMGNQKALGVANNNLGTMVLQEQMEKSSATAESDDVYFAGVKYFEEAIRIGTFEYQNADFDDDRGDYVTQLANRYFNRGIFYIVNRNHPMANKDSESMGVSDLNRAKSLDAEAHLMWRERGQLLGKAKDEFNTIVRRFRGILTLVEDVHFRDVWGLERLIEMADDIVRNPQYSNSSLFEEVSIVARKQQILDMQMQYALSKGDVPSAARIAIKILVEDEYIIDTVIMNCVTTLNKYYGIKAGDPMQIPNLAKGVKRETRRGAVDSMRQAKNVIFCLDYSGSMAGERIERANKNLLWVYEEHCLDKDYVGFVRFNHAVDDKLFFDLGRKGEHQDTHERILKQATDAEGGTRLYAALHKCVAMANAVNNKFDCWIIALTDGESSWDFPAKQVISMIEKHNKKGGHQIHVIVIGFEVGSEVADSVQKITKITDKSMYIDARGGGLEEMDNAFEQVAAVIKGKSITMETF